MLIKPLINTLLPLPCEAPALLLPWLTHQNSLTERLQEKAGKTRLEVLGQCWELPDWWDKQVLQIIDETVLHREILMWASKKPCWYARTIIPKTTYDASKTIFDRLKNESLGALIFNDDRIKRVSLSHYPIDEQTIEYHWLTDIMHSKTKPLWVRISTFIVTAALPTPPSTPEDNTYPFCLLEIMLPGIMRYLN